jgi:hypothetical protein
MDVAPGEVSPPTIRSELRWLMDRAAEWGVYVRLVLPETMDQIAQWNAPCPRWRSRDVFAGLQELERLGWIRFSIIEADETEVPVTQPEFNHQALIDAYRFRRRPILYKLTDAGGVAWEQAANPHWEVRYDFEIRGAESPGEAGECVITAMTEPCAREALLVTACCQNLMIVPGSERYTPIDHWKATYWKEMASGFQAIAAVGRLDYETSPVESLLPIASQRHRVEIHRKLERWFKPIDEPNWQRREYLDYGGMWK